MYLCWLPIGRIRESTSRIWLVSGRICGSTSHGGHVDAGLKGLPLVWEQPKDLHQGGAYVEPFGMGPVSASKHAEQRSVGQILEPTGRPLAV